MSQADQKQIKIGQQLAISQNQSFTTDKQQYPSPFVQFQLLPSFNQYKTSLKVNTHRMSENVSNRRPQPIFIQNQYKTSHYDDISPGSARDGKMSLQKMNQSQVFSCKCPSNIQQSCPYCLDTKIIKGDSNVIKFFEYVIAFKMGANQSFNKKHIPTSNNLSITQYPNQSFNTNRLSTHSQYNVRQTNNSIVNTTRMSTKSRKYGRSEIESEFNNINNVPVHQNYCCDHCQIAPIVGNRYHCIYCEDYDQCEQCYRLGNHSHSMEKIDSCGKSKQLKGIMNLLTQPQNRKSLRPPPSIKKQGDLSTIATRSAIR